VSEENLKIYGQTETDLQCCISHPLQTGLFKASVVFWTLATQTPNSNLTACSEVYT
jgi:hypothetical protein